MHDFVLRSEVRVIATIKIERSRVQLVFCYDFKRLDNRQQSKVKGSSSSRFKQSLLKNASLVDLYCLVEGLRMIRE